MLHRQDQGSVIAQTSTDYYICVYICVVFLCLCVFLLYILKWNQQRMKPELKHLDYEVTVPSALDAFLSVGHALLTDSLK